MRCTNEYLFIPGVNVRPLIAARLNKAALIGKLVSRPVGCIVVRELLLQVPCPQKFKSLLTYSRRIILVVIQIGSQYIGRDKGR